MPFPFPEPRLIHAEVFAELPTALRRTGQKSYWADRNRRGATVDSFLEGPSFDTAGNLWFVDIPFGRMFRSAPDGTVTQVAEYDGQPNGLTPIAVVRSPRGLGTTNCAFGVQSSKTLFIT